MLPDFEKSQEGSTPLANVGPARLIDDILQSTKGVNEMKN